MIEEIGIKKKKEKKKRNNGREELCMYCNYVFK
jgi:hypothetical protein